MNEEKLKVCLLNDSFPPTIDGVANTVVNYASVINEHYGTPIVLTPKYPKVKDDYPYEVIRYPSLKTQKILGYRAGYPFSNRAFRKVKEAEVDIIHSHCPFISTMISRSLQRICDVPLVFTYHTKFDVEIQKLLGLKMLQKPAINIMVDNISACDEVWVVSEGAGKNLRSLGYQGDYRIMENGVDFPLGKTSDKFNDSIMKKYKIRPDAIKFLFVGRMRWYKGIELILNSLKRIKDIGIDFQMVFAGDGMDFADIKILTKKLDLLDKCIFTGAIIDREELRGIFSVCDLFLFPSLFDTNGIVVREAAACAVPSVLIGNSCASEGITDMETGFIIENSVESMVAKLKVLTEHPEYIKGVGENAQKNIYLSWDDAISKAVERYHVLIENYQPKTFKHTKQSSDKFYNFMNYFYDLRSKFYKN